MLVAATGSAPGALSMGPETVLADEIDDEVNQILAIDRKQLLLEGV
ncbi:hypothetical protein [Microseira wollei]|nr:hypothetical protein [Microseira wollei]